MSSTQLEFPDIVHRKDNGSFQPEERFVFQKKIGKGRKLIKFEKATKTEFISVEIYEITAKLPSFLLPCSFSKWGISSDPQLPAIPLIISKEKKHF